MSRKRFFYVLVAIAVLVVAACAPQGEPTAAPTAAPVATPKSTPTSAPAASPAPASSEMPLPLAYWGLDGDGTASVGDSVLEFSGAYALSDTAVSFDGYTGSASTTAPGPIDTMASFTVSAWVNLANRSAIAAAVSQLGEITGLFQLGVGEENRWWFFMKTEDRTGVEYGVSAQGARAIPGSSWTHLVGVHDREAGMLRLYVDGDEQGEAAFTTPLKAEGPLTIGRAQFDSRPGNFWPGAIGEVAVYQTALTAGQVADIYQTTKPTSPPPAMPAPDPSTYGNGILNGTWDYVMTAEDRAILEADLEAESGYDADELHIRLGFDNHEWWQGFVFDGELWLVDGVPEGDGGTFRIEDNLLIQIGAHGGVQVTYSWVLDGDQLTLTAVEECAVTPTGMDCRSDRAQMDPIMILVTEHIYTKSGDDASYSEAVPVQGQASTIILRLASVDETSAPSAPYVLEFAQQVSTLSDGKMTIQPVWRAGDMTPGDAGTGTIQLVREGEAELGLTGSANFDTVDILSFQALQAPYLIDNDALAKAVATSDVARQMLDDPSAAGIIGLTLWPEQLRHPLSLVPDKSIVSPQDLAGLDVKMAGSNVTSMLIEAMGGTPTIGDTYQAREIGLRQLDPRSWDYETAVATGNVTFNSKFMVLFANEAALKGLTEAQRSILRAAAAAAQAKAIAEHPGEANIAKVFCENGGTIVIASEEQVAAFKTAAKPVLDWIEQDPESAAWVVEIRQLKESIEPSAGAEACAPEVAQ